MDHQGRPLVPEAAHAQFATASSEVIESADSRQQGGKEEQEEGEEACIECYF